MNGTLWYYSTGTSELGPVTTDELLFLAQSGTIGPQTRIRADGSSTAVMFQRSQLAKSIQPENRKRPPSVAPAATFRSNGQSHLTLRRSNAVQPRPPGPAEITGEGPLPKADHRANHQSRRTLAAAAAVAALLTLLLLWLQLRPQQPGGFAGTNDGSSAADSGTRQTGAQQQSAAAADDASSNPQSSIAVNSPATATEQNTVATNTSLDSADLPDTPSDTPSDKSDAARTPESGNGINAPADGRPAEGLAVGRGTDQRFSISAPGETTFFGIRGSGKRFSWVVDCSGSMSSKALPLSVTPLQRAKQELLQSLQRLPQGLEFQIIFFDDFCFQFPNMGFAEVSPERIREAADFIRDIQGGRGTNVQIAMQRALAGNTRPDTVFLLTDGEFDSGTPSFIASRNRNQQTRINTVAFVTRDGESLLRQIAAENRGDFRFVP